MPDSRRIYSTFSKLAVKVEVIGDHQCVKINDKGVWPLADELRPKIIVTIGHLVKKARGSGKTVREFS